MEKRLHCRIGIDEVGRGPLAGPVCVGAVFLTTEDAQAVRRQAKKMKLADSKKLTDKQRRAWVMWMRANGIAYALSYVSSSVIDRIHIHHAVNRAAQRSYQKIGARHKAVVIADGTIQIIPKKGDVFTNFPKADEMVPAVSLASIVAKTHRDARMERLHRKFGRYDFLSNKGYGTRKHIAALMAHGPCKAHRLTFVRKYTMLHTQHN